MRVRVGYQQMSGADLANPAGQETDILLVLDTLAVTTPVERLGYQHLVVTGTLVAPPGSEVALAGRVTTLGGQVVYTTARPRVITGGTAVTGLLRVPGRAGPAHHHRPLHLRGRRHARDPEAEARAESS